MFTSHCLKKAVFTVFQDVTKINYYQYQCKSGKLCVLHVLMFNKYHVETKNWKTVFQFSCNCIFWHCLNHLKIWTHLWAIISCFPYFCKISTIPKESFHCILQAGGNNLSKTIRPSLDLIKLHKYYAEYANTGKKQKKTKKKLPRLMFSDFSLGK